MGSSRFARRYSGSRSFFPFLGLLRCISSPACPPYRMCSGRDDQTLLWSGSPIRRSAGQRLFSASPRLIAAVHVLHRLLVPRHPPCALSILTEEHHGMPLCRFQGAREAVLRREQDPRLTKKAGPSKLNSVARKTHDQTPSMPGRHSFQGSALCGPAVLVTANP